jgi:predicted dehydrogenase
MKLIRTGVIGTGYLGKFHADKYSELAESELVGIVDTDYEAAQTISNRLKVPAFKSYEELFDRVDAVSIVVPTELHHKIAKDFLLNGIDVLVEKPMTTTLEEAEDLIETAKKNKCVLQVGHLERFNAAVLALNNVIKQPLFIESHRLAPFKDRGTDVDVILDIMIHDIDIILNIVGSPVKAIHAVGVPVVSSENNDIANVRLEFESGCVANVTASRISAKEMRKIRIFQHDKYLSIDYAAQQVEVYGKTDSDEHDTPQITYDQIDIKQGDSLKEEIRSFLNAVKSRSIPEVPGEAGKNALKVALEIVEQIETKKTTLKI